MYIHDEEPDTYMSSQFDFMYSDSSAYETEKEKTMKEREREFYGDDEEDF